MHVWLHLNISLKFCVSKMKYLQYCSFSTLIYRLLFLIHLSWFLASSKFVFYQHIYGYITIVHFNNQPQYHIKQFTAPSAIYICLIQEEMQKLQNYRMYYTVKHPTKSLYYSWEITEMKYDKAEWEILQRVL